jgi:methylated-DNA-[protein]-cysteine S-methyltransferase
VSYGQLARQLGLANGARAVGLANGANPLPIIVPCHRVIGADGSLTGFGGGLPIKRALLSLEGAPCAVDLFAPELPRGSSGGSREADLSGP